MINFGDLGQELANAWLDNDTEKQRISDKLRQHGFSSADIDKLFNHVKIITVDETSEEEAVFELLRDQVLGIDPRNAFDLLHAWLFSCMEKQQAITIRADSTTNSEK